MAVVANGLTWQSDAFWVILHVYRFALTRPYPRSVGEDLLRELDWVRNVQFLGSPAFLRPHFAPDGVRHAVSKHVEQIPRQNHAALDEVGLHERNGEPFTRPRPHRARTDGRGWESGHWKRLCLELGKSHWVRILVSKVLYDNELYVTWDFFQLEHSGFYI